MIEDPKIEGVAILTYDGEVLDSCGKTIDMSWVKDLVTMINMIGTTVGVNPQSIEIDAGDRKVVVILDPPFIRIGVIRDDHRK